MLGLPYTSSPLFHPFPFVPLHSSRPTQPPLTACSLPAASQTCSGRMPSEPTTRYLLTRSVDLATFAYSSQHLTKHICIPYLDWVQLYICVPHYCLACIISIEYNIIYSLNVVNHFILLILGTYIEIQNIF